MIWEKRKTWNGDQGPIVREVFLLSLWKTQLPLGPRLEYWYEGSFPLGSLQSTLFGFLHCIFTIILFVGVFASLIFVSPSGLLVLMWNHVSWFNLLLHTAQCLLHSRCSINIC